MGDVYRLQSNKAGGYSRHKEVTIADHTSDFLGGTPVYFVLVAHNEFLAIPSALSHLDFRVAELAQSFGSVVNRRKSWRLSLVRL